MHGWRYRLRLYKFSISLFTLRFLSWRYCSRGTHLIVTGLLATESVATNKTWSPDSSRFSPVKRGGSVGMFHILLNVLDGPVELASLVSIGSWA